MHLGTITRTRKRALVWWTQSQGLVMFCFFSTDDRPLCQDPPQDATPCGAALSPSYPPGCNGSSVFPVLPDHNKKYAFKPQLWCSRPWGFQEWIKENPFPTGTNFLLENKTTDRQTSEWRRSRVGLRTTVMSKAGSGLPGRNRGDFRPGNPGRPLWGGPEWT